jgi:hypothetical protein
VDFHSKRRHHVRDDPWQPLQQVLQEDQLSLCLHRHGDLHDRLRDLRSADGTQLLPGNVGGLGLKRCHDRRRPVHHLDRAAGLRDGPARMARLQGDAAHNAPLDQLLHFSRPHPRAHAMRITHVVLSV